VGRFGRKDASSVKPLMAVETSAATTKTAKEKEKVVDKTTTAVTDEAQPTEPAQSAKKKKKKNKNKTTELTAQDISYCPVSDVAQKHVFTKNSLHMNWQLR